MGEAKNTHDVCHKPLKSCWIPQALILPIKDNGKTPILISFLNQKTIDTIEADGFVAEIIRTNRKKTVSIKVAEGKVSVVAPKTFPAKEISALVAKKQRWIKQKLAIQNNVLKVQPKQFIAGESFSYLGNNYRLKIESGPYPDLKFQQEQFIATVRNISANNAPAIKQMLIKWYQQQAETILRERTKSYSEVIGVTPSKITIKLFKVRWGSCSIRREIQYNWKIIMAPKHIIDYLVVHELCHIQHHNHSPLFWKTVAKYHPEYKECKVWLKNNASLLEI